LGKEAKQKGNIPPSWCFDVKGEEMRLESLEIFVKKVKLASGRERRANEEKREGPRQRGHIPFKHPSRLNVPAISGAFTPHPKLGVCSAFFMMLGCPWGGRG